MDASEFLQALGDSLRDGVATFDYATLPAQVQDFIIAHPTAMGSIAAGGAVMMCPPLLTTPLWPFLGLGAAGPVPGGYFAGAQAVGWLSAGMPGILATLQSAAMGGGGAAAVNSFVALVGGSVAAAGGLSAWIGGK